MRMLWVMFFPVVVWSAQAAKTKDIEGLSLPVKVVVQGVVDPAVADQVISELEAALDLLYGLEPENYLHSLRGPAKQGKFAKRRIEFVLTPEFSYEGVDGHHVPLRQFSATFLSFSMDGGRSETMQVGITLDPAVISPRQERALPFSRYHFLRVLLRPYFAIFPVHLGIGPQEAIALATVRPEQYRKKSLESEERFIEFLRSLNERDWKREDALTLRAYLQLAWFDWAKLAAQRRWMTIHAPANAPLFEEVHFTDRYVSAASQADFWRTYGAAMALVRLLPLTDGTPNLFTKLDAPPPPGLLALTFVDSRDAISRQQCGMLKGKERPADHFADNLVEVESFQAPRMAVTSAIFWGERVLYHPQTGYLDGKRLAKIALALSAAVYHSFESFRRNPGGEWTADRRSANTRDYHAAARSFYERLKVSPYWGELSEEERLAFDQEVRNYSRLDAEFVDACAIQILRDQKKETPKEK